MRESKQNKGNIPYIIIIDKMIIPLHKITWIKYDPTFEHYQIKTPDGMTTITQEQYDEIKNILQNPAEIKK